MNYDLIVVGLGIYGSAIAERAGEQGLSVLAVDKFVPPHDKGSSHGNSRIFRLTTVEGEEYAGLARTSDTLWKKYDLETKESIIVPTGFALISQDNTANQLHHGVNNLMKRAESVAKHHDIEHKVMVGREFNKEFPGLNAREDVKVFYEPGAYIIRPDIAVKTLFDRASKYTNVKIITGVEATNLHMVKDEASVEVTIGKETVRAKRAVLCTGPWQQSKLLGKNIIDAKINPQVTLRIPIDTPDKSAFQFPGFVHLEADTPLIYGVPPSANLPEFKLGIEQDTFAISSPDEFPDKSQFIAQYTKDIKKIAHRLLPDLNLDLAEADVCYYTVTSNSKHIIASPLDLPAVTVVSACSGHGFKYAPAVAQKIVEKIALQLSK